MMELIERAIPVIQHPPEARELAEVVLQERPADASAPVVATDDESRPAEDSRRVNDDDADTGYEVALAGVYAALERLRLQHAQLTSGAILQTYHRQITFEVADSRPGTKLLSVQG